MSEPTEAEKRVMAKRAAKEMLKLFPPGEAEESRLAEWVYQSAERERKAWKAVRGIR